MNTAQAPDPKVLGPFLAKIPSGVLGPVSLVCLMVVRPSLCLLVLVARSCDVVGVGVAQIHAHRRHNHTTFTRRAPTPSTRATSSTP